MFHHYIAAVMRHIIVFALLIIQSTFVTIHHQGCVITLLSYTFPITLYKRVTDFLLFCVAVCDVDELLGDAHLAHAVARVRHQHQPAIETFVSMEL